MGRGYTATGHFRGSSRCRAVATSPDEAATGGRIRCNGERVSKGVLMDSIAKGDIDAAVADTQRTDVGTADIRCDWWHAGSVEIRRRYAGIIEGLDNWYLGAGCKGQAL